MQDAHDLGRHGQGAINEPPSPTGSADRLALGGLGAGGGQGQASHERRIKAPPDAAG